MIFKVLRLNGTLMIFKVLRLDETSRAVWFYFPPAVGIF